MFSLSIQLTSLKYTAALVITSVRLTFYFNLLQYYPTRICKQEIKLNMAKQKHPEAASSSRRLGQDRDCEMLIDLTSDSDDTLMDDSDAVLEAPLIDLTGPGWHVPESEQTAENGWIEILETPNGPYDFDNDPAGLYGGREVDDRPSLIEFYHQDARTNCIFARMAPTKAELASAAAAKAAPEARGHNEMVTDDEIAPLELGKPQYTPLKVLQRYAQKIIDVSSPADSGTKRYPLRSSGKKKGNKNEKQPNIFDYLEPSANSTKDHEDEHLKMAIDASLVLGERKQQTHLTYQETINTPKSMQENENADLQQGILVSKEIEVIHESGFRKALSESTGNVSPKRKRSGSQDRDDEASEEFNDFEEYKPVPLRLKGYGKKTNKVGHPDPTIEVVS